MAYTILASNILDFDPRRVKIVAYTVIIIKLSMHNVH